MSSLPTMPDVPCFATMVTMSDKIKYTASAVMVLAFLIGYNMFLIQRDNKLFKAYDACQQFTHRPGCSNK